MVITDIQRYCCVDVVALCDWYTKTREHIYQPVKIDTKKNDFESSWIVKKLDKNYKEIDTFYFKNTYIQNVYEL